MKKIFIATLLCFSAAPNARAINITAGFDCVPAAPLASPMNVGWEKLVEVISFTQVETLRGDARTQKVELKSRMIESMNKKELVVVDQYKSGEAPLSDNTFLPTGNHSPSLRFDSVTFRVTRQDIPFSAGPVMPGTYPAKANLVLVSAYRGEAYADNKTDVRVIEMNCKYSIAYPM